MGDFLDALLWCLFENLEARTSYQKCEMPVFLYHLTDFEIGHDKFCFWLGVSTKVEEPDSFSHRSRPVRIISAGWFALTKHTPAACHPMVLKTKCLAAIHLNVYSHKASPDKSFGVRLFIVCSQQYYGVQSAVLWCSHCWAVICNKTNIDIG